MSKSIPNIIDCDMKKDWQILIIFGTNISNTAFNQMTVLVPTLPNVCFCTTCGNSYKQSRTQVQYFISFVFPGSAETDNGCGGKLGSQSIASCVKNNDVKNY